MGISFVGETKLCPLEFFFSSNTLNISFYSLFAYMVSDEKSAIILILLQVTFAFLCLSSRFFVFFVFYSLNMLCLGILFFVVFLAFVLLDVLLLEFSGYVGLVLVINFRKFSCIIISNIFSAPFFHSFWYSNYTSDRPSKTTLKFLDVLLFFHSFFSLNFRL